MVYKIDNVSSFPCWNPRFRTTLNFRNDNFLVRYMALRNSSYGFIKKLDVRMAVFNHYNHKCYICGSSENLQIDHIVSIYKYAKDRLPYITLNSIENLAAICRSCNSKKAPY